jgi:hypothetical protein
MKLSQAPILLWTVFSCTSPPQSDVGLDSGSAQANDRAAHGPDLSVDDAAHEPDLPEPDAARRPDLSVHDAAHGPDLSVHDAAHGPGLPDAALPPVPDAALPPVPLAISAISIVPVPVFNDSDVVCEATLERYQDAETTVGYIWERTSTGDVLGAGPMLSLAGHDLRPAELLTCRVVAVRGEETIRRSLTVALENRSPRLDNVVVDPPAQTALAPLRCLASASDPDGEALLLDSVWMVDDAIVGSGFEFVPDAGLAPGTLITCSATATDGSGESDTASADALLLNAPPIFTQCRVAPEHAPVGTPVECLVTAEDPDRRGVDVSVRWSSGSTAAREQVSPAEEPGTRLHCTGRAVDSDGAAVECRSENAVLIENTPPVLGPVTLDVTEARAGERVTCAASAQDADGDVPSLSFLWGNGSDGPTHVLDPRTSTPGETFDCAVSATDPHGATSTARSERRVLVLNSAPEAIDVALVPPAPEPGESVTCALRAPPRDPDDEPLIRTFVWERNGVVVHETSGDADHGVFPRALVTPLQRLTCRAVTTDPHGAESPFATATTVIGPGPAPGEAFTDPLIFLQRFDADGAPLPALDDGETIEFVEGPGPAPDRTRVNTPPPTASRLLYVANDGDNDAAALVHGRGYYLPSDPEIGPDPTQPVGPIVAYASLRRAEAKLRRPNLRSSIGTTDTYGGYDEAETGFLARRTALGHGWNGYPDWLLLARGSTFESLDGGQRLANEGPYWRGRSDVAPMVVTAWGPLATARPVIQEALVVPGYSKHLFLSSLDIQDGVIWGDVGGGAFGADFWAENLWLEDLFVTRATPGSALGSTDIGYWDGVMLRHIVVTGAWNPEAHNQGVYVSNHVSADNPVGSVSRAGFTRPPGRFVVEASVFDLNGYKEPPRDPRTWTAGVVSGLEPGPFAPGEGAQPFRTFFDRNIYVSSEQPNLPFVDITLRGNLFSRGGGGGSVQQRQGGIRERNVFLWNEDAGFVAGGSGGIVRDNLVLHDDHMLPPGGWGNGMGSWADNQNGRRRYVYQGNIVAHMHRGSNGPGSLYVRGGGPNDVAELYDNVVYRQEGRGFRIENDTLGVVVFGNNRIAVTNGSLISGYRTAETGDLYRIGDDEIGGNLYFARAANAFDGRTFEAWQAQHPLLDSASSAYADFDAFRQAAGFSDPERDIIAYMHAIEPGFEPDEDVSVDAGAYPQFRRLDAPLVRDVLQSNRSAMTDTQARLTARRYHAFLRFMEGVYANRRGHWDARYTADALNNYIREGFGLPPVVEL